MTHEVRIAMLKIAGAPELALDGNIKYQHSLPSDTEQYNAQGLPRNDPSCCVLVQPT